MNQEEINKEIFTRLSRIEEKIFRIKKIKNPTLKNKRGTSITKPISELINNGFFDISKNGIETLKELKKNAISCDINPLRTALMRFVRKGILIREGSGTKNSPWKYKKK